MHTIREVRDEDVPWILALNAANEVVTSALDGAKLRLLLADAFHARTIGDRAGYMLPLQQSASYDSENFQWFLKRHMRFVYVDRIVIADHARGQGLARAMYEDLFAAALRAEHRTIACEVNVDPPNVESDAFHARLGFTEVGRATLTNGKTVRYLTKILT